MDHAVYGAPPADVAPAPAGAVQVSPLWPGATALETLADASVGGATVLAPPGVLERRHVLAQILRVLEPGGELVALAPKDKGGSRLKKELEAFGCAVEEGFRRRHRICHALRPAAVQTADAIAETGPRLDAKLGLWTWPGVFSWDRVDPGTALLIGALPPPAGQGADLGCGVGVLSQALLASPGVTRLHGVDIDRRAVECARRNLDDPRMALHWADVRRVELAGLDFVVCNPPFHDAGAEDRALGQAFIQAASRMLRKGGTLWLVANRHLPYEATAQEAFAQVRSAADAGGYKVLEARR